MKIEFTKMQGAGNDFIMVDNRNGIIEDSRKKEFVTRFCPRAVAVGADGVVFLENDNELDAKWDFYNADGSSAEMCGNGARCFTLYAIAKGVCTDTLTFRTIAGPIGGSKSAEGRAEVTLTDAPLPEHIQSIDINGTDSELYFINTGVPHAIMPVDDIEAIELKKTGAAIRYHQHFAPAGTNANFICEKDGKVIIRTYERGVEDETLACGTGSVAAAIVGSDKYCLSAPVTVITRSGDILNINFEKTDNGIKNVRLEGPAVVAYQGTLEF